jgi:hypothetical protein
MRNPLEFKNFCRLKVAIDTRPFAVEINEAESLWFASSRRQTAIKVQRETQSIFLRSASADSVNQNVNDIQECVRTPHAANFPLIMRFLEEFAESQKASLERAMIVRLTPYGQVYPHVDKGRYYEPRNRYHFVLNSPAGSKFQSGDEVVIMQQGELWWFQNKLIHAARNDSPSWRVHVVFDLLPTVRALAEGNKPR